MVYKAKVEFLWYKVGDIVSDSELKANPHWITYLTDSKPINELDLNKDGKVDEQDKSLANKVLSSLKKKK
jgi:hypothetical protein